MRYVIHGILLLLTAATLIPAVTEAQIFNRRNPCNRCQLPQPQCCCPAVPAAPQPTLQVVPQTTYQPVVETQYATQPELQYRDVAATEYRTEAVNESIPVTAYDSVTVDEGGYQTVWVPKPVTRQVARTVYQPRISYRTVPYQTTRRVAEYTTKTVPYQTVRYVPTTTNTLAYNGVPSTVAYSGVPIYAPATTATAYPWQTPIASAQPTLYAPATSTASASLAPVPDARFASSGPSLVPPAAALDGYQPASTVSSTPAYTADRSSSPFVPAPSAAQVWRTPRSSVTR